LVGFGTVLGVQDDFVAATRVEGDHGKDAAGVDGVTAVLADGDGDVLAGGLLHEQCCGTCVEADRRADRRTYFGHGVLPRCLPCGVRAGNQLLVGVAQVRITAGPAAVIRVAVASSISESVISESSCSRSP